MSVLDLRKSPYKDMSDQVFYRDLNLDQVIDRIAGFWGRNVRKYYYYYPADAECAAYRREVLADVKNKELYDLLCRFVGSMEDWQEICSRKAKVREEMQKSVWHIVETGGWCDAMEALSEGLSGFRLSSRGLSDFQIYLNGYLTSEKYGRMRRELDELRKTLGGFRIRLTYEDGRLNVSEEPAKGEYEDFVRKAFPGQETELKNPFAAEPGLSVLEYEVLQIFRKKHEDFFRAAARFYKNYREYTDETLLEFSGEITFYLSFVCFENKMKEVGCAFSAPKVPAGGRMTAEQASVDGRMSVPEVSGDRQMSARGLYDLALACVSMAEGRKVVSNDMFFEAGESFFVLTGPNQGGKTTFARSLGQLVYFAKMGLDVPALEARVPWFERILTHFSVEESVETGRGKLKEELMRLAPMMEERGADSFVVINELFTTAANYDACIMGKKVLEHFVGQDCRGIYVTHLKELAEAHPKIVSLRAMLDEGKKPTFRIMRSEAEESAYAINQVNKYHLTYEQLRERLS